MGCTDALQHDSLVGREKENVSVKYGLYVFYKSQLIHGCMSGIWQKKEGFVRPTYFEAACPEDGQHDKNKSEFISQCLLTVRIVGVMKARPYKIGQELVTFFFSTLVRLILSIRSPRLAHLSSIIIICS